MRKQFLVIISAILLFSVGFYSKFLFDYLYNSDGLIGLLSSIIVIMFFYQRNLEQRINNRDYEINNLNNEEFRHIQEKERLKSDLQELKKQLKKANNGNSNSK